MQNCGLAVRHAQVNRQSIRSPAFGHCPSARAMASHAYDRPARAGHRRILKSRLCAKSLMSLILKSHQVFNAHFAQLFEEWLEYRSLRNRQTDETMCSEVSSKRHLAWKLPSDEAQTVGAGHFSEGLRKI